MKNNSTIGLIGPSSSGKKTLLNTFFGEYDHNGMDAKGLLYFTRKRHYRGDEINVTIKKVHGEGVTSPGLSEFFKDVRVVILTVERSYTTKGEDGYIYSNKEGGVTRYIDFFNENFLELIKQKQIKILLVGTKSDSALSRYFSKDAGLELAKQVGAEAYFECSRSDKSSVITVFQKAIEIDLIVRAHEQKQMTHLKEITEEKDEKLEFIDLQVDSQPNTDSDCCSCFSWITSIFSSPPDDDDNTLLGDGDDDLTESNSFSF